MIRPAALPSEISLTHSVSSNHRYQTFEGFFEQKPAFVKIAKDTALLYRIQREAEGLARFQDIAVQLKDECFTLPKLYAKGADYIVYSFEPGKASEPTDKSYLEHLRTLVDVYASVDRVTSKSQVKENLLLRSHPVHAPKTYLEHTVESYRKLEVGQLFDLKLLDHIIEYLRVESPKVAGQFAHGDLTTSNTLWQEDKPPVIIDFESCSMFWPQYYELINCIFNRYILQPSAVSAAQAAELIDAYKEKMEIVDAQQFIQVCNVTVAWRGLGILIETLGGDSGEHATKATMNHETAARLSTALNAVLANRFFASS